MAKITDVGEHIPNAKKHSAQKRGPGAGAAGAEKENRLAQLWPEPDWKALSKQRRYEPHTLASLAITYWGLGTAPLDKACFGLELDEWPAMYDGAIKIVRQVFDEAFDETLPKLRERASQIAGINRMSSKRESMKLWAAGRYGGRKLWTPFSPTPKLGWLGESMPDLGWPEDDSCLKVSIGVIALRQSIKPMDPQWMVITTKPRPMTVGQLNNMTRRDAIAAARLEIQKRLSEDGTARALRKAVTKRSSSDGLEREGPDYLGGWDISGEELLDTFKFRGLQFGESLSDKEKQRWLNEAFCALHDLARVIGFEPHWLGLGGGGHPALALAIGARGHGQAMAHFEPELFVFNLTRDSGAGSLAHEFAHALDVRLARQTFADGFVYTLPKGTFFTETYQMVRDKPLVREKSLAQFHKLAAELYRPHGNPFFLQARHIEELKGARKQYWTTEREMWARSFETYVQDRLHANGEASPWLVHGTLPREQHEPSLSPYPIGAQRQTLAEHWEAFLSCLGGKSSFVQPTISQTTTNAQAAHEPTH